MERRFGSELALANAQDKQRDDGEEEVHTDELGGGEHTRHHGSPAVKLAEPALVFPQEKERQDRKKQHQPIWVPPQAIFEHRRHEQQQEIQQHRAVRAELVLHINQQEQRDERGQQADHLALHQHEQRQVVKLPGPAQGVSSQCREPEEGEAVMVIVVGDEVLQEDLQVRLG